MPLDPTPAQSRSINMLVDFCANPHGPNLLTRHLAESTIDWGYLLYFADINGLLGWLWHMTDGLDDSRVPWRAAVRLTSWVKQQRRRWIGYLDLLCDMATAGVTREPPILLKGAALKGTIYADMQDVRGLGDIDILIAPDEEPAVVQWLEGRGYQLRGGKNGSTAFREDSADRWAVDLHCGDPAKTQRAPEAAYSLIAEHAVLSATVPGYRAVSLELAMVHACKHFCEHEADFRKVFNQDDMRLFRLVDILMLLAHVDVRSVVEIAERLGWIREVHRCIGYVGSLFKVPVPPSLPEVEAPRILATPVGDVVWPWSFVDRLLRVDRAEWLSTMLGEKGRRSDWYGARDGERSAP